MTATLPAPDTPADTTPKTPALVETAAAGRRADADRRHQRVLAILTAAIAAGDTVTLSVAALARAAGVHRSYLYRHPELVDLLHQATAQPSPPGDGSAVTTASLRADLAHTRARATRAETLVRRLQQRLSEALGQQVWAETGLGPVDEAAGLRREVEQLRQHNADLVEQLDERDGELEAARAANRELMGQVNGARPRPSAATPRSEPSPP